MEINRISNGFPVFKLLEATFLTSLGTFGSSIGGTVSLSPGGVVSFPGGFVLFLFLIKYLNKKFFLIFKEIFQIAFFFYFN